MYVVNLNKEINMGNKCPDKLEPQYLTSVLKNVPVELMWHLREYHSKPSHFEIKWKARQPVEGKKYGWGGNLKWEDAKSGDMYVRDRSLEQKYQHLLERYREQDRLLDEMLDNEKSRLEKYEALDKEYKDLLADHIDGEEWKARHDDMLREVNKPAIREECDGVDYEAVTKGIKGLINLLRR
jgi:hypothetical protein